MYPCTLILKNINTLRFSSCRSISIVAGGLDLNDNSQFAQVIQPMKIEIHPNYTGENNNFQNDICLLHLGSPLNLNSMTQTIALENNESRMGEGTMCIISGWGSKQVCSIFIYHKHFLQ